MKENTTHFLLIYDKGNKLLPVRVLEYGSFAAAKAQVENKLKEDSQITAVITTPVAFYKSNVTVVETILDAP